MTRAMFEQHPHPATRPCKCCGAETSLFGVVDFAKNCLEPKGLRLPVSGIPIYYHRCGNCGFLFTGDFDDFDADDFKRWIYNDDYTRVDPDWRDARPRATAALVARNFGAHRQSISVLDYGSGSGRLADELRAAGFAVVASYDPMIEAFAERPAGRFDLILCVEVLEHVTDPARVFADIAELRADGGMVFHTTLLQPREIETERLNWWYAAPRNGHVSIHTAKSLALSWSRVGLRTVSANQNLHFAYTEIPAFAAHVIKPAGSEPQAAT